MKKLKVRRGVNKSFFIGDGKVDYLFFLQERGVAEYGTVRQDNKTTTVFTGNNRECIEWIAKYLITKGYNGNH